MAPSWPAVSSYFRRKRLAIWLVAAGLLVLAGPLILLLLLLVRVTSRGPAIYRQVRVGRHGRPFVMYKIRTMRQDAEALTGAVWARGDDPRATRLGRFLRRTHLDELPQLANVVRGQMCLLGPRPERPEIVDGLIGLIPGYLDRLAVLPGVTGLAQIALPPDEDLSGVRRKLAADLAYVRHAQPTLDLKIIACTLLQVCGVKARTTLRWCRIDADLYELATAGDPGKAATQRRAA
jgi:lipopolysaccharide/colanic/teichoic acid biosynthesis glycosyltransferase